MFVDTAASMLLRPFVVDNVADELTEYRGDKTTLRRVNEKKRRLYNNNSYIVQDSL